MGTIFNDKQELAWCLKPALSLRLGFKSTNCGKKLFFFSLSNGGQNDTILLLERRNSKSEWGNCPTSPTLDPPLITRAMIEIKNNKFKHYLVTNWTHHEMYHLR